jgi:hypothetical protein
MTPVVLNMIGKSVSTSKPTLPTLAWDMLDANLMTIRNPSPQ